MSEKIEGRRGNLLRIGLGARNWVLVHIDNEPDVMAWKPQDDAKSSNEIIEHIAFTLSAVCGHISEELGIDLDSDNIPVERGENPLVSDIQAAYILFRRLCDSMADEMLDNMTTLPPPARLKEGTVETILRIIAGYHSVHHAGQIAMLVKRAKKKH